MTRHLIIGGGPAAINAVETIRDFDGGASTITLVSDEPAYSRMVLPYHLSSQIPRQQVFTG
jgi:NAD(P)H-nitrite reductase large subunit